MTVKVQFHFDFGSPNTYYCHKVIPEIEARTGVNFEYFPILLGGIFRETDNKSPMEQFAGVKNKNEYQALESARFREKHGITDFRMNPNFPVNTLYIMRGAIFAQQHGFGEEYIDKMYSFMWEQELKMDDPGVIHKALSDNGLPADEIIAGTADPEIKKKLIDNTIESVERGTFGSPTIFVSNEIYFGKDKLRDVEEEIVRLNSAG
jgi:2-hydroxychromene-2-carboxylate isomerase